MSAEIIGLQSIDVFRNEVILLLINETIESGYDVIKDLFEEHRISEKLITSLSFESIDNEKRTMEAHVQYFIITKEDFNNKSKEDQIRYVLNRIGYKNEDIKSIEYRKYHVCSPETKWVASIIDKEFPCYWDPFKEDPLNSIYDEKVYLKNLYNKITSALDFDLVLDICPN